MPLWSGALADAMQVRVMHEGTEVASTSRGLATYDDGSVRSVQVQFDLEIARETDVEVQFGAAAGSTVDAVPVEDTLVVADGTEGPRVWALLPASWLSQSGVAGPQIPAADASLSLTINDRSALPFALMPHATPAARKPAGAVTPPAIVCVPCPSAAIMRPPPRAPPALPPPA